MVKTKMQAIELESIIYGADSVIMRNFDLVDSDIKVVSPVDKITETIKDHEEITDRP